jgi:hypothetical protein
MDIGSHTASDMGARLADRIPSGLQQGFHAIDERDAGFPVKMGFDLSHIGAGHFNFAVQCRSELDFSAHQLGEREDAFGLAGSKIVNFAGTVARKRADEGIDDIRNVNEIPPLPTIAHDGHCLSCERLLQERPHETVAVVGFRSVAIENSKRNGGDSIETVPVERGLFGQVLAQSVGVCRRDGMIFTGRPGRLPVDRCGRGVNDTYAAASPRGVKNPYQALYIGPHITFGIVERSAMVGDPRAMNDTVDIGKDFVFRVDIEKVAAIDGNIPLSGVASQARRKAGAIESTHPVSFGKKFLDTVDPQKTSGTGDKNNWFFIRHVRELQRSGNQVGP